MYEKLAEEFGLSQKKAREITARVLDLAVETAKEEGRVFCGRGNYFKRVDRQPRNYRNPRTGEIGTTEPVSYVVFRRKV